MSKLLGRFFCAIALLCAGANVFALPPLGLTQISSTPISSSNLEIIDESAYLGVPGGVWTIDTLGDKTFVAIAHPTHGSATSVTRVVEAFDGDLYVAANFGSDYWASSSATLYALSAPSTPINTWTEPYQVYGVDAQLRTFGNFNNEPIGTDARYFYMDGTSEPLAYPPGSSSLDHSTSIVSSTPNGYAVGGARIPGTLGGSPAFWTPTGDFTFVFGFGSATSIRERIDGQGINIGANLSSPNILLGQDGYEIKNLNGEFVDIGDNSVIVSHSDFVVFDALASQSSADFFGYYPGIVPGQLDWPRRLLEIFPELASIDIDIITDLASVDGYIYMTINGSDGLYLFGARDPSVIPEPTPLALAFLCLFAVLATRRRSSAANL